MTRDEIERERAALLAEQEALGGPPQAPPSRAPATSAAIRRERAALQAELRRMEPAPAPRAFTAPEQQALDRARLTREVRRALPLGLLTAPAVNMVTDPTRRRELMRSAQGLLRDAQQIPSLDLPRLAGETAQAVQQGVTGLPDTLAAIASNLPSIAWEMTGAPFVREEQQQRALEEARIREDEPGATQAAQQANAATGGIATNAAGLGAGVAVRTPLQAAGLAATLTAPNSLARDAERPLQERLPQALAETGGAAAFGGVAQYGANRIADALTAAPPRTGQMVERFERAGIDPSLAAVNGPGVSGIVTNSIADNLAAGPMVRARMQRQLTQARDATHNIAQRYGSPRSLEGAGGVVQRGVTRYARERGLPNPSPRLDPNQVSTRGWSFASKAEAVFDHALEPVLDNAAPLTRTMQALGEINRRADAPLVRRFQADPVLSEFERTAQRLQRGASDSFEAAAADDVAAMAAEIEAARRAASGSEQSLATWVRRRGGIRDDRGDVRGMDPSGRGASTVISQRGRTIDDLAANAWEEGFFPGDVAPTAREFIDALERDLRSPGSFTRPGGANAEAANARDILRYYEQQGVDVNLRGQALQRALRPLTGVDEGTGGQPPTLRDLRELRRRIRMAQTSPGLAQTVDNAALQRLEAALTADIYEAAGDAAPRLQAADRFYRAGRQRIDDALAQFIDVDPGRVIPRILELARPQGNTRTLAALRGALPDDDWRTVQASIIEHIGQPTAGAADFSAHLGFSVRQFATAYRKMSPQARRILFGTRGSGLRGEAAAQMRQLADDLDNLAEVVLRLKGVEAMQNSSRSTAHLSNLATGAGAIASLPLTLSTIAALGLMGEVLTNPAAVRWLTSASRAGAGAQGMRRLVADFGRIAARDPALYPVLAELQARAQVHESGPSGAQSVDRPRLPQTVP